MPLLLDLLAPLLKKRDTWYLLVILVLALLLCALRARLKTDEAVIAARPAVHTEAEQQSHSVRVAGPVRVVTKTVYVPGTTQVQYVERDIERGQTTTTTEKDSHVVKDVRPACPPAPRAPWRYAGVTVDPLNSFMPRALRGGVSLWGRLDVGGSFDWKYRALGLEAAVRF
jgi:hypothetical protein